MTRSALRQVNPISIYSLQAVFDAVSKDKTEIDGQIGMTMMGARGDREWMKHWPPVCTSRALGDVLDLLGQWKEAGVTHVVANAPFSDGDLTGPVENLLTTQIRNNGLKPATEEQKRAFGL